MKNFKLILQGLIQAVGVAVYVGLVSFLMRSGGKIFGEVDNFFGPIAFLLLFVLSAAITGSLTLGRSILMYVENQKSEAVKLFGFTLGWMFVIILVVFSIQLLIK